ncbi:MAG: CBS domain-containing protein [Alphaproteobacteria bacterium]
MNASELMTREVVSVSPDMPVREVARVLLSHRVSAAPVVDGGGNVVGMISEGDLIGPDGGEHAARRERWLEKLAEGEALSSDFLASLKPGRIARDVMSAPVVEIGEATEAGEIAALLLQHHVKRVPVVRDGRLVGIVSRADLLRSLADAPRPHTAAPAHGGILSEAIAGLDRRFFGRHGETAGDVASKPHQAGAESGLNVTDFQSLMTGFERHRTEAAEAARHAAVAQRQEQVKQLIDEHVRDENWNKMLHDAREAAERGDKESLLLRFPSDLCADRGRAINSALPDWPSTLRGEAAEIYLRWERELRPRGFHLAARVLDFPGGMPGDIGLFLGWAR